MFDVKRPNVKVSQRRFWIRDTQIDGGEPFYPLELTPTAVGTAPDDDFAVLKTGRKFKVAEIKIPAVGADPPPKQHLMIFHFPYPQPLTVTQLKCVAVAPPSGEPQGFILRHTCDTDDSSSGGLILNSQYEIVGIHTRGGRTPQDSSTFNEGLLISRIVSVSPLVKASLAQAVNVNVHVPESRVISSTAITYTTGAGDAFIQSGDTWTLVPVGRAVGDARIPLKSQGTANGKYILWDYGADVFYEIPADGGSARSKKAQSQIWDEIGTVTKQ